VSSGLSTKGSQQAREGGGGVEAVGSGEIEIEEGRAERDDGEREKSN
jgi:hypothetical protein